jgi:glycosyltransferase involved in cell wall biosynthesis
MKVSIITAVLNGEDSIAATLRSVAQQSHPDIEHIIVDGGSTDATLDQLARLGQSVARVICEPDNGPYDAFNKGLRAATGDVIGYLNCGDHYVSSDSVSKLAATLSTGTAEAVFGDVLIVDGTQASRVIRRYSSRHFTPRALTYGLMPAHPTLFMTRGVYRQIGEYDAGFRIAGDFELCVRAFLGRRTEYRYLAEPLVRMPTGGLSNRGWHSKLEITKEMLRACRQNGIKTNRLKLSLRFPLKVAELL